MRSMNRNRQVFYEASLTSVAMGTDTDGNYTEEVYTYSNPTEHTGVITAANGEAVTQLFGANERYDKVITLNQGENYLAIGSVLWVDTMPTLDDKGKTTTPYDYIVVKVAESLNFVSVAIRKVNVS